MREQDDWDETLKMLKREDRIALGIGIFFVVFTVVWAVLR